MRVIDQKKIIEENYSDYLKDESSLKGDTDKIIFPESGADVREIILEHHSQKRPVTISNGRTGITGGAVPFGTDLVSLEKLNRIKGLTEKGLMAEAGVSLQEIDQYLEKEKPGYFYPVDVTEPSARLGGTIATDACGSRSFYFSRTRKWVNSISVVLADGIEAVIPRGQNMAQQARLDFLNYSIHLPEIKKPGTKNSAGYFIEQGMDLIDLFIGSEGTLGIITEAEIRLAEKPDHMVLVLAFFPAEQDGLNFFFSALKTLPLVYAYEYFDANSLKLLSRDFNLMEHGAAVLMELDGKEEQLEMLGSLMKENHSDISRTWTGESRKETQRIRDLRHRVPEAVNQLIAQKKNTCPAIVKVSTDIAVPMEHLKEMYAFYKDCLSRENIFYVLFGHIGEAHLHLNMVPEDEQQFDRAWELYTGFVKKAISLGGTFTAEHGVGRLKKEFMKYLYSTEEMEAMKGIKKILDPDLILNPGVLF